MPSFLNELCPSLEKLPFKVSILVADDGSGPEELAKLTAIVEEERETYGALLQPVLELSHEQHLRLQYGLCGSKPQHLTPTLQPLRGFKT